MCQSRCLGSNPLKHVIDKAVHNAHGFAGDTGIGMHLLQYLVDVNSIALLPPPLLFLIGLTDVLLGLTGFLHSFSTGLRRHDETISSRILNQVRVTIEAMGSNASLISEMTAKRCANRVPERLVEAHWCAGGTAASRFLLIHTSKHVTLTIFFNFLD